MGTLNPYRAPFLDGNWIIDPANTIGVNHFQLKLISEMFEMFVLLINEINPHSFSFVTCFLFIFTVKLSHTEYSTPSSVLHIWEFAVAICRGFFVYISESFFVYVSKSCLYGGKPFLYVCKTFWFVRFSLLTVLLLVIVVAVMSHGREQTWVLWLRI